MKISRLAVASLATAAVAATAFAYYQLRVVPNDNHIAAKRMQGCWNLDVTASRKLDPDRQPVFRTLKFTSDETVLPKLTNYVPRLGVKELFGAGYVTLNDTNTYPYVLTTQDGNPTAIWFEPQGDDAYGKPQHRTVWVAIARDNMNDMLMLGGTHTWDVQAIYNRTKCQ